MRPFYTSLLVLLHLCAMAFPEPVSAEVQFETDVMPILEQNCLRCHYPGNSHGDVSLATSADLVQLDYLQPGQSADSYLIELVTEHDGQQPAMPKDGDPLSPDDVATLRKWIDSGALWPDDLVLKEPSKADKTWWSLQPLKSVTPPDSDALRLRATAAGMAASDARRWVENPIDRFVLRALLDAGLLPNPPASGRDLLRRMTYDVTGLPPTPDDLQRFEGSEDAGTGPLIDRLLASPAYGEQWGRHWLDVVRFGESTGYEQNVIVDNAWPFRDWVIESLNADKPFDQFIREHIAGDCLGDDEATIGSAFLVNGPYDTVGNQDAVQAAQIRANTIDEMIRATSEAFLGLTIGCARCHDHKFDPIPQSDYYQLYATFAGVHHGSEVLASSARRAMRAAEIEPLEKEKAEVARQLALLDQEITERGNKVAESASNQWTRPAADRRGTTEQFPAQSVQHVRLKCLARDDNPHSRVGFQIDELEIWTSGENPHNVALASEGATASGPSRAIEDFPGAYGPQLAIDGRFGERFISTTDELVIHLPKAMQVDRIVFSSARVEEKSAQGKFAFVGDYVLEGSLDAVTWFTLASSQDRQPASEAHRTWRLRERVLTDADRKQIQSLDKRSREITTAINRVAALPTAWIGTRSDAEARQEHHIFVGGSPQRKGAPIAAAAPSVLDQLVPSYRLGTDATDASRRLALADRVASDQNALTARVLANRVWHYHFGTGIVSSPSDFGYMGSKPSHPELLDWLAKFVVDRGWRIKDLHRLVLSSQAFQQSTTYRETAARQDADARLLWRFPPRRLTAEEIRDTWLCVAGVLSQERGGPGFRLYRYLRDNVATYVPLDVHGPETYRRAVYHQTARASRTDFMTDFDQPDCAFSTAQRAETTTPLQALCSLNHSFSIDIAEHFAKRLQAEMGNDLPRSIERAFLLCYTRKPSSQELEECQGFVREHSLAGLCRVLLNTSELIYLP